MNTTQPRNTTNRPPTTTRRGSALLLAVGVLLLVFLAGVAFVSSSQSARIAGSAASRASSNDAAIQATVNYIGQVIARDWTDYTTGVAGSEYHDYPHPDVDPWLASTEPEDLVRLDPSQQNFLVAEPFTGFLGSLGQVNDDGDGDNTNDWEAWRNVSNLTDSNNTKLRFIDLEHFLPLGDFEGLSIYTGGTDLARSALTYHPTTETYSNEEFLNDSRPFNPDQAADADGDGYIDSRWVELPINAPGGLRWAAAVRIIDESALANVNTATEIEPIILQPRDSMVLGTTPADLDLQRLLARTDFTHDAGNNADWGNPSPLWFSQGEGYDGFVASDIYQQVGTTGGQRGDSPYYGVASLAAPPVTSSQVPREALYKALGYPETIAGNPPSTMPSGAYPYNRTDREARYHLFGRNLDQPSLARYSTTNQGIYTAPWNENNFILAERPYIPFGTETLAELRTRFGLNSPGWSALEYSLYNAFEATDGNGFSVLRSNRIETPGYASRRQMRQGIRHLITTYSGARQVRPALSTTPYFATAPDRAKLNLDQLYIEDTAGTSPSPEAQAFLDRAEEAGLTSAERHALLANLMAYRIPGVYDDVPANLGADNTDTRTNTLSDFQIVDGATTYTGLEAQPFFREAVSVIIAEDPPDANQLVTNENRYLLVELANPWSVGMGYDADVQLEDFSITILINGTPLAAGAIPLNPGTLGPGDELLLSSPGIDPATRTAITAAMTGPATQAILPDNAWAQGDEITFELRYTLGGANLLVDRFEASFNIATVTDDPFPLDEAALYGGEAIPADGETVVYSNYLRRDDTPAASFAHFVLEDSDQNEVPATPSRTVFTPPLPADYSAALLETFGDANNGVTFTPAPPDFQLHLGKQADGTTADTTAPTLDSVAELGLLLTVAHETGGAAGDIPISENLAAAINAANERYFAKLDWENVPAGSNDLPDPVNLMDQFTTVQAADSGLTGTATPALNPGMAFGVVNINTAPQRVLEALPYTLGGRVFNNHPMTPGSEMGQQLAAGLIDYRDKPATATTIPGVGTSPFDVNARQQATTGVTGLRNDPGFASIGEIAMARTAAASNFTSTYLSTDGANTNEREGDFTSDNVTDDLEEELLPLIRTAALTSVRSDVFTAYVLLQGRRPNPDTPTTFDKVVERRFIVTYDRSNVNAPGDQPRVLMFIEDR
ncbi:MAG: hypothetical protein RIG82_13530 [Phycisphaeraceae bacterium]